MRWFILLLLCITPLACQKTIHEARTPQRGSVVVTMAGQSH